MGAPTPPAQKARVVAYAIEHTQGAAARKYGISQGTVSTWCKEAGVQSIGAEQMADALAIELARRTEIRERLRTQLIEQASDMLTRMNEEQIDFRGKDADQVTYPKANASDCRSYAQAAGTLIDKYRLEVGEATERTEWNDQRERAVADARERGLRLIDRQTG